MTVILEGERSFWLGTQAALVEDSRELAWAETFVKSDPHLKWIVGRFAEAERANLNGHIFPLKDHQAAAETLPNKPLNMLHFPQRIVGHFVAAQMIVPGADNKPDGVMTAAADDGLNAYIDALSAFYAYYFPDQLKQVEKAHAAGLLSYSMEAVPDTLTCPNAGCGLTVPYNGKTSPAYCGHLNKPGSPKRLNKTNFLGGALIIPPASPAWSRADITQMMALMEENELESAGVFEQVAAQFPHMTFAQQEVLTAQVVMVAQRTQDDRRDAVLYASSVSMADRMRLAKEGKALKDGSYPIETLKQLKSAIILCQSGHGDVAAAKALIIRRANDLGGAGMLPTDWRPKKDTGGDAEMHKHVAAGRVLRPYRASALVAAGLAVKAQDTGRVLMIQRSILDDTDPAAGTWEFPGGHIETGEPGQPAETPFEAARREWEEETGAVLPAGQLKGSWTSPNGVYQGFVYVIRSETDVPANTMPAVRHVLNPDDPDGDDIEVAAWWDLQHLPDMPALRPECQTTDWALLNSASLDDVGVPAA